MAFPVASGAEVATATTVASYTVNRLGTTPVLVVHYAETVEDGVNVFNITAQRQTQTGRAWDMMFRADTPDRTAIMGQMLVGIMSKIGRDLLTALNLSAQVTDAQLTTAVTAMDNVDSYIASALEKIEEDRRVGQATYVTVMGSAPAVVIPPPPAP